MIQLPLVDMPAENSVVVSVPIAVPATTVVELLENLLCLAGLLARCYQLVGKQLLKPVSHIFDKSGLPLLMAYCSVYSSYYSPFNSQVVILSEAKDLIAACTVHITHL